MSAAWYLNMIRFTRSPSFPSGRALGVTMFLPEQDKYSVSRLQLDSQLAALFGGRVAEELVFGVENVTTGASNDIERATAIARNMVTKWGLTEKLGPLTYSEAEDEVFLGRSVTQHKSVSDDTARLIDVEVRKIIDQAHQYARDLLEAHDSELKMMADALIKYETIDGPQIDQIMQGQEPDPPEGWGEDEGGSGKPESAVAADDNSDRTSVGGPAEQL